MTRIVPYLLLPNSKKAIEFYTKVFDAKLVSHDPFNEEIGKGMGFPDDFDYKNSTMHAEITIADGLIMMADSTSPLVLKESNVDVMLAPNSLDQIETYYNNAKKHGAKIIMPLEKQFWGAYFTRFKDPFGVGWQLNFTPPDEETPKKKITKKKAKRPKKKTNKK